MQVFLLQEGRDEGEGRMSDMRGLRRHSRFDQSAG